jgi:hypothetical protein
MRFWGKRSSQASFACQHIAESFQYIQLERRNRHVIELLVFLRRNVLKRQGSCAIHIGGGSKFMTHCARDTHAIANPNSAFASHLADDGWPSGNIGEI